LQLKPTKEIQFPAHPLWAEKKLLRKKGLGEGVLKRGLTIISGATMVLMFYTAVAVTQGMKTRAMPWVKVTQKRWPRFKFLGSGQQFFNPWATRNLIF
jgi:hypothetical protein